MDSQIYDELITQEKDHWWFVSRREIAHKLLRATTLTNTPRILDVGCGTGGNLTLLKSFGEVFGIEIYEPALQHARKQKIGKIEYGTLPNQIPFEDLQFDLVVLFDVLEHIEDDQAALAALVKRMTPGAIMYLTVPSYQWLFSRKDHQHHHKRRYSKRQVITLLEKNGLQVQLINHWNCLLLPVAILSRMLEKLNLSKGTTFGSKTPAPWLNKLLIKAVSLERFLIPLMPLPFGLSLIIIAKKTEF